LLLGVGMADQILEAKSDLRREMIARRDALPPDARSAAAEAIAARPFPLSIVAGTIVSGFMPMKSEINPLPLMKKLADAGARLALPVTGRRGQPLVMRSSKFGPFIGCSGFPKCRYTAKPDTKPAA